jgi:uncharacterized membrane protein YebE (DUF533 family)
MFDATRLLGAMFENNAAPSAGKRLDHAASEGGLGAAGGPLAALLGGGAGGGSLSGLLGSLAGGAGAGQGGGLADLLRQATEHPGQALRQNNPMAVGGLGALAGALLGGGRGAVGGGLLAALGSLAVAALQGAGETRATAPGAAPGRSPSARDDLAGMVPPELRGMTVPAASPGFEDEADVQRAAMLALRAMIAAAKADGRIDDAEIDRIAGQLEDAEPEARDFVRDEMRRPLDLAGLAAQARTPKEAAEIYAASLMAIEVDTRAERDHLARLADALGLSRPVVERIHQGLGVPA